MRSSRNFCYRRNRFRRNFLTRKLKGISWDFSLSCIGGGFPLVTGPLERDSTIENNRMRLLEFQERKSMIFTLEIKMNHFTLSAVKSKQIELRSSACCHLIAFLQNFLMVTDFHMFLRIICPQIKKTWRTLILSKIVCIS